jgi:hydroxylamine reductase
MGMFCYQCQETAKNTGCTVKGVCGKNDSTANLHDLLIFLLQGISIFAEKIPGLEKKYGIFIYQALFATITNANFDDEKIEKLIGRALIVREELKSR